MTAADVVVVGGGPVGLHAALKAAVLGHSVVVVDKGRRFSRVAQADAVAGIPLAPGISGDALLDRLRASLAEFARLRGRALVELLDDTEAVAARRAGPGFAVRVRDADGAQREVEGAVLVLATGVVDRKPGISAFERRGHETLGPWVARGAVGYCVMCEGWETEARRVAVVGGTDEGAAVAQVLAEHFGARVTWFPEGPAPEDAASRLAKVGARVDARPVAGVDGEPGALRVRLADGAEEAFDKAFLTLGWYKANNELARMLGAATTRHGYVVTDENSEALDVQGRPIRGLFAVGDLRAGRWKQVVAGWGDADTAVTFAYARRLE